MALVTFDGLAAGGESVGRDENGRAVFAFYAAPGDLAHVVLTEESPRWARGELQLLETLSPARVAPPCPYFGRNALQRNDFPCGGCDWQHIEYARQLEAKRSLVVQALTRIGRLTDADSRVEACAPSPPYGYRNKASFVAGQGRIGFRARGSHELVDIETCLIQSDDNNAVLTCAREAAARGLAPAGDWKLTVRAASSGESLAVLTAAAWPASAEFAAALSAVPSLAGVLHRVDERAPLKKIWGRDWLEETVDGLVFRVRADGFFQTNSALVSTLFSTVLEWSEVQNNESAVDLFCGAGLFSLGLARAGAEVTGIERSRAAIEDGRANAARNGLAANFVDGDVGKVLGSLPRCRWSLVVLDPPRAGAAAAVPALLKLAAPRIVYVSCDPATLARDVAALGEKYEVVRVRPLDMFPQTAHVETVCLLRLR